MTMMMMHYDC